MFLEIANRDSRRSYAAKQVQLDKVCGYSAPKPRTQEAIHQPVSRFRRTCVVTALAAGFAGIGLGEVMHRAAVAARAPVPTPVPPKQNPSAAILSTSTGALPACAFSVEQKLTSLHLCLYFRCMDIFEEADAAVQRCEHELREIGARAIKCGKYDAARRIMKLAEVLADSRTLNVSEATLTSASLSADKNVRTDQITKTSRPKRTATENYPHFLRRGEKLVKVGWSKKNRAEYEHTAPQAVVSAFAAHLRDNIRSGRIFSIESILPILDPNGNGDLPTYQIYLALAWLRSIDLVEKRGRDGYVGDRKELSDNALTHHWAALPSVDI